MSHNSEQTGLIIPSLRTIDPYHNTQFDMGQKFSAVALNGNVFNKYKRIEVSQFMDNKPYSNVNSPKTDLNYRDSTEHLMHVKHHPRNMIPGGTHSSVSKSIDFGGSGIKPNL